eukprot:SAG11_NODE_1612_length_4580_cov_7.854050_2_plen_216_part_00
MLVATCRVGTTGGTPASGDRRSFSDVLDAMDDQAAADRLHLWWYVLARRASTLTAEPELEAAANTAAHAQTGDTQLANGDARPGGSGAQPADPVCGRGADGHAVSTARRASDGEHNKGEDVGAPGRSGGVPTAEDGGVQPDGSAQPRGYRLQSADPTCNDNDGDMAVDTAQHTDGVAQEGTDDVRTQSWDDSGPTTSNTSGGKHGAPRHSQRSRW